MYDINHHGQTEIFALSEATMSSIPCSRLERAMMVLSSTPHQALLILHTALQGEFLIQKIVLRKNCFKKKYFRKY